MFSGQLSAPLPDLRENSLRQLTFSYNNFTGLDLWGSHLSDLQLSWNTALFGTLDDFFTDLPALQSLVTRFGSFLMVCCMANLDESSMQLNKNKCLHDCSEGKSQLPPLMIGALS